MMVTLRDCEETDHDDIPFYVPVNDFTLRNDGIGTLQLVKFSKADVEGEMKSYAVQVKDKVVCKFRTKLIET